LPKRSIIGPSQFPFFFVLMLQAHMCNILSIQAFICTLHWFALHDKEEPVHKSQLVEWRRDDILVTFASQKMTLTVTTPDSAKLFLAPKGPVLGENVRYRSPKVIYLPNKGSFRPPARIH
jgi:hypothetical protein